MASHNLEQQPEERLFTEIADLRRQLTELRTLQQQGHRALQIKISPPYQAQQVTLPPNESINFVASLSWTTPPPSGNVLLAEYEFALFINTVDTNGIVSSQFATNSQLTWNHWRDLWLPDIYAGMGNGSYPVTDIVRVTNVSAADKNVHFRSRWRYLVVQGEVGGVTGLPNPPDGPQPQ